MLTLRPNTRLASSTNDRAVDTVEEVEVPQIINYETLTVKELKAIAKEKGIVFNSKTTKAELIEKLG